MPDIDTTNLGLDSINLKTLPEQTRHQILQLLTQSQGNRSGSAISWGNSQQSNPCASSRSNSVWSHSQEVCHQSTASSDYNMEPPSPSNTPHGPQQTPSIHHQCYTWMHFNPIHHQRKVSNSPQTQIGIWILTHCKKWLIHLSWVLLPVQPCYLALQGQHHWPDLLVHQ